MGNSFDGVDVLELLISLEYFDLICIFAESMECKGLVSALKLQTFLFKTELLF